MGDRGRKNRNYKARKQKRIRLTMYEAMCKEFLPQEIEGEQNDPSKETNS